MIFFTKNNCFHAWFGNINGYCKGKSDDQLLISIQLLYIKSLIAYENKSCNWYLSILIFKYRSEKNEIQKPSFIEEQQNLCAKERFNTIEDNEDKKQLFENSIPRETGNIDLRANENSIDTYT